jgi:hypothetical protein
MEDAMRDHDVREAGYPTVDFIVGAIADWVNRYRGKLQASRELGQCSPDEVRQTAKDLGLPESDLRALAAKGPGGAERLRKMLLALHVDPDALAKADPAVMRDLQRLCAACGNKRRCDHEFARGTAARNFHEFCPNAYTLDALFEQEKQARH